MPRLYYRRTGGCCVAVGCSMVSGTNALSQVKMFRFPKEESRKSAWVAAIRRKNWAPTPHSRLCSHHFISGCPSLDPTHPDWAPSIFAYKAISQQKIQEKVSRYERSQRRAEIENNSLKSQRNTESEDTRKVFETRNLIENNEDMKPHQHGQCSNIGMDNMSTVVKDLQSILEDIAKGFVSTSRHPLRNRTGTVLAIRAPHRNLVVWLHHENNIAHHDHSINDTVFIKQEPHDENLMEFQKQHDADPVCASSTTFENMGLSETRSSVVENIIDDFIDLQHYESEVKREIVFSEIGLQHSPSFDSNCELTPYMKCTDSGTIYTKEVEETDTSLLLHDSYLHYTNSFNEDSSQSKRLHRHNDNGMAVNEVDARTSIINIPNNSTIVKEENESFKEDAMQSTIPHERNGFGRTALLINSEVNENTTDSQTRITDISNSYMIVKEENEPFVESSHKIFDKEMKNTNCSVLSQPINMYSLKDSCVNDTKMQERQIAEPQNHNFNCPVCSRTFVDLDCFNVHIQEMHSMCNQQEAAEQYKVNEKHFQCPKCEKTFASDFRLMQHSIVHKEENLHRCEICGKRFTTNVRLKHHMNVHSDLTNCQCSNCGRIFSKKLKSSKNKQLVEENSYQCLVCEKNNSLRGKNKFMQRQ